MNELDNDEGDAVTLMVDSVFATSLAKNPIAYWRSNDIEMKFHYFRELVS